MDAPVLMDVDQHGYGLHRLTASELTLARPEAPQIAGRALRWVGRQPRPPADAHSDAYDAVEVQSVLRHWRGRQSEFLRGVSEGKCLGTNTDLSYGPRRLLG